MSMTAITLGAAVGRERRTIQQLVARRIADVSHLGFWGPRRRPGSLARHDLGCRRQVSAVARADQVRQELSRRATPRPPERRLPACVAVDFERAARGLLEILA